MEWAVREGAVLWLDVKDAPPEFVVAQIRECRAEAQLIVSAYGTGNLAKYMSLAPELVYFIPTQAEGLPDPKAIRKHAADIGRVIGFAGYYIPDMEHSLQMHKWDAPMQLELSRYDELRANDELDQRYYDRALHAGFQILCTNHYPEVAKMYGLTQWNPKA